ncbi:SRPBCC family protein [Polyangium sp. y55x31]|uniref:type II toxin-antitoxin system RatA family toxin n=1 Tax=Polyangium sp. y55x31 TaxID=3042688 RepID=UPI002482C109|nr:SRPBCC family protein [Polyangium sp. y55x31]MDI1478804.1 SRPBCC family protein [Polyangium sp. y55x31]
MQHRVRGGGRFRWLGALGLVGVLGGGEARAEPARGAASAAANPTAVAVPIPGSDLVRGRAKVIVAAPIDAVRARVLAFGEYARFMPHYSSSKILGRTKSGDREIYMEVTALHGAVRFWARMAVRKSVAAAGGVETYDVSMLEGNVKDFHAVWRLRAIDEARTELELEVFLLPRVPLPASLLNTENLQGASKGVRAMRSFVEGKR